MAQRTTAECRATPPGSGHNQLQVATGSRSPFSLRSQHDPCLSCVHENAKLFIDNEQCNAKRENYCMHRAIGLMPQIKINTDSLFPFPNVYINWDNSEFLELNTLSSVVHCVSPEGSSATDWSFQYLFSSIYLDINQCINPVFLTHQSTTCYWLAKECPFFQNINEHVRCRQELL